MSQAITTKPSPVMSFFKQQLDSMGDAPTKTIVVGILGVIGLSACYKNPKRAFKILSSTVVGSLILQRLFQSFASRGGGSPEVERSIPSSSETVRSAQPSALLDTPSSRLSDSSLLSKKAKGKKKKKKVISSTRSSSSSSSSSPAPAAAGSLPELPPATRVSQPRPSAMKLTPANQKLFNLISTAKNTLANEGTPKREEARRQMEQELLASLRAGADINTPLTKHGSTALMIASYLGYSDMVELLIKHRANVNQKNSNGESAIHFSIKSSLSSYKILSLLILAGAHLTPTISPTRSLLDLLAESNSEAMAFFLLEKYKSRDRDRNLSHQEKQIAECLRSIQFSSEQIRQALAESIMRASSKEVINQIGLLLVEKFFSEELLQAIQRGDAEGVQRLVNQLHVSFFTSPVYLDLLKYAESCGKTATIRAILLAKAPQQERALTTWTQEVVRGAGALRSLPEGLKSLLAQGKADEVVFHLDGSLLGNDSVIQDKESGFAFANLHGNPDITRLLVERWI